MNRNRVFLCLLLLPGAARAADPRPLTLGEALRAAETNSPAARAIDLSIERARAAVPATGLWQNPELTLTREESAGVVERFATLSQTLPIGGRTGLARDAARSGLIAAEASARQERVVLRRQVRDAFVDLLVAQDRLVILEAHAGRLATLAAAFAAREREGESSGFDRRRVAWEAAEGAALLDRALGDRAAARAALGALVGPPASALVATGDLAEPLPTPDPATLETLVRGRGDLAALDAEAARADQAARAARRRAVPEPSITAGAKNTEAGPIDDTGLVLGLTFALPFLDRGQESHVGDTEAALLRARRETLALQAAADAEGALATVVAARDAESAYATADDPDILITIARAAYDGGALRLLELLDAYRTAALVRLRTVELHAAARQAESALIAAAGAEAGR